MGDFSRITSGGQREEILNEIPFARAAFNRAAEERECLWKYHLKCAEILGVFTGYVPSVFIATEIGIAVMEGFSPVPTKMMAITLMVSVTLIGGSGAFCGYRLANRVFQWLKPPPTSI